MSENAGHWEPFQLLLIDVQNDFWRKEISGSFPDFEENVGNLLDVCRREQIDVAHLRAAFRRDRSDWMVRHRLLDSIPCIEGSPGADTLSCAADAPGEKIIEKQTFDGFRRPELQAYLAENNKRFLLIAGLVTSVCVLLTAATAAQRGYLVALVEDCCADTPEAHRHTLGRYPFIFDRVTVDQITANRDRWLAEIEQAGRT